MAFPKIGLQAVLDMSGFNDGLRDYEQGVRKAGQSGEGFAGVMKSIGAGIGIVTAGIVSSAVAVQKALEFGRKGAIVTQTADSFDGLIQKVGAADDTLDRLRAATNRTVDDMTLMKATTVLLAGAEDDLARAMAGAAPQLAQIAKAANKLNPTLGDTAFLYESLGTGIKRSSPLILDNLGLTIKVGEANEAYAAKLGKTVEQLSAADKQMALLEETLRAGDVLIGQAGGSTESAADSFARLDTAVKNLTDHLAAEAAPAIGGFADLLYRVTFQIFEVGDVIEALAGQIGDVTETYDQYVEALIRAAIASDTLTKEEAALAEAYIYGDTVAAKRLEKEVTMVGVLNADTLATRALTREQYDHAKALALVERYTGDVTDGVDRWAGKQKSAATQGRYLGKQTEILGHQFYRFGIELQNTETYERLAEERAKDLEKAYAELNKAVLTALNSFAAFYGQLAQGIVGLRDLGIASEQSAKDYRKALRQLNRDAADSYEGIRKKYEDSLPDKTSVADRMDMAADAWDEFGLRAEDVIQRGAESPWWGTLQDQLNAIGETQPPDVGIQEWMKHVQDAFYAGDLPQLINQDAAAWKWHADEVKKAQDEEAAAVAAANAKKRRELQKAREAELQAEQEARERATIELSLQLAEQSGLLQQWSMQRFGPDFSQVADSASEVMALLDAGMLDIDSELGEIITNTAAGVSNALDITGQQAEETKAQLADLISPETMADAERQANSLAAGLRGVGESGKDALAPLVEEDPFAALSSGFTGAVEAMVTGAGDMDTALTGAFKNVETAQGTVADAIMDRWLGQSVIPDMIQGGLDFQIALSTNFNTMQSEFYDTTISMEQFWADYMENMRSDWRDTYDLFMDGIKNIRDELDDIPREIQIKIKVTSEGAGPTEPQTELPTEPPPTGEGATSTSFGFFPPPGMAAPSTVAVPFGGAGAALAAPVVQVTVGPNTINTEMDQAVFEARVLQTVVRAVRG